MLMHGHMTTLNTQTAETTPWNVIANRIERGEPDGFRYLYNTLASFRWFFATRIGDDAEDAYHELQLALIENIRRGLLREPSRLVGYAMALARGIVAARIRRRIHSRKREIGCDHAAASLASTCESPESCVQRREMVTLARRILTTLPPRDREVLTQFYLQEQPWEEICREMALTPTQFRLIKSRARKRFDHLCKESMRRRA